MGKVVGPIYRNTKNDIPSEKSVFIQFPFLGIFCVYFLQISRLRNREGYFECRGMAVWWPIIESNREKIITQKINFTNKYIFYCITNRKKKNIVLQFLLILWQKYKKKSQLFPGMKKWSRGKGTMLTASFRRSAFNCPGNLRGLRLCLTSSHLSGCPFYHLIIACTHILDNRRAMQA